MRTRGRVDSNQAAIVQALREVGASVQPLSSVGGGCPDILVAYRGKWLVAELKDGDKRPSARRLTEEEKSWHERFGEHAPVYVWYSIEDALAALELM